MSKDRMSVALFRAQVELLIATVHNEVTLAGAQGDVARHGGGRVAEIKDRLVTHYERALVRDQPTRDELMMDESSDAAVTPKEA